MNRLRLRVPALLARARALLKLSGGPADRLAPAELGKAARAVERLHEGLIGGRELARLATYGDPAHLGAYLLWWWPQTYAKVQAALDLARAIAQAPESPQIVDLGAGPAPAALGLLDALGSEALAVDASAEALAEARILSEGTLDTQQLDLAQKLPEFDQEFDIAVIANALSELPAGTGAALIEGLPLAPDGLVLLIEPALRETGRALLELRDALLRGGRWKAVAPCLTQRPCPALAHPRDWCTAERGWDPPAHVIQIAGALGLRADEQLSYAPLVLARAAPPPPPDLWRVVGVPRPEKGKRRLFVCSDQGRLPVARLDREESPSNADFERLGRGDLVRLRGLGRKGDGLRVAKESAVERVAEEEE